MSMVEGCTVVGGMDGIVTHSTMSEIADNHVSRTTMRGISMTEMSMGMIAHNEVRDARGVGILCNDRSMCMIERNTVVDTQADNAGGDESRAGFGILASAITASRWSTMTAADKAKFDPLSTSLLGVKFGPV